jgi:hypothetical protein
MRQAAISEPEEATKANQKPTATSSLVKPVKHDNTIVSHPNFGPKLQSLYL